MVGSESRIYPYSLTVLTRRPLQIYLGPEVGGHIGIEKYPGPDKTPGY